MAVLYGLAPTTCGVIGLRVVAERVPSGSARRIDLRQCVHHLLNLGRRLVIWPAQRAAPGLSAARAGVSRREGSRSDR